MEHNKDFLTAWEHIVADVSKTDVPLECIKKIVIKFHGGRQKTYNLSALQKQGMSIDESETMLTRTLTVLDNEIRDIDFVVDVSAVANLVQPETNKILSGL